MLYHISSNLFTFLTHDFLCDPKAGRRARSQYYEILRTTSELGDSPLGHIRHHMLRMCFHLRLGNVSGVMFPY